MKKRGINLRAKRCQKWFIDFYGVSGNAHHYQTSFMNTEDKILKELGYKIIISQKQIVDIKPMSLVLKWMVEMNHGDYSISCY